MINLAIDPISNGVNPKTFDPGRLPAGVAYVVLDRNMTREDYISNCKETNSVVLMTNNREIIRNCVMSKESWNSIEFPYTYNDRGSAVLWINVPIYNRPVIVGVINKKDDKVKTEENQSVVGRRSPRGAAEIMTDSDRGIMQFNVKTMSEGGVSISVQSDENDAYYKAYVQGDISMEAEDQVAFRAQNGFEIVVGSEEVSGQNVFATIKITNDLITIIDTNGNTIQLNDEGLKIIDTFENRVLMTEDNIVTQYGKDGASITIDESGIKENVSSGGAVNIVDEKLEEGSKEPAAKGTATVDVLDSILDEMVKLSTTLSTLTVVLSTGVINPAVAQEIQQSANAFGQIKGQLDKIKSSTLNIT